MINIILIIKTTKLGEVSIVEFQIQTIDNASFTFKL